MEEELHASIASFLRDRRGRAAGSGPAPAAAPPDLAPRLRALAPAYGRRWLLGLHQLPAFVQLVAAEAAEDRLGGIDEYPGVVRAEMRHAGRPHADAPHAAAPNEAQQAIRILRDAGLWPWRRALWRGDSEHRG